MIYLDNAATSFPKAPGVANAVAECINELPGSAGRASHAYAVAASEILYDARLETAAFFGMPEPERLVFTKNATEAINIVLMGALPNGGKVVVSSLEHNAVMRPLRYLESSRGVSIDVVPFSESGRPDLSVLEAALTERPNLLAVTAASNVTGAVVPLAKILAAARRHGVPVLVDACQLAGHARIDIAGLDVDYFAFSGHKGLLGPAGVGGLWLGPGRILEPLIRGGTGSASASEIQPDFLPDRYEAGTHNIAALAGLSTALRYISHVGIDAVVARESELAARFIRGLGDVEGLRMIGPKPGEARVPVISCICDAMPESDVAAELDRRGIAIRMGLQCAPAAHRSIGTYDRGGTLRFSPGYFTTEADIDGSLIALKEILS